MKKGLLHAALLVLLFVLIQTSAAQAAPGDFLFQWGSEQHFYDPAGVAVDGNGRVYVTDCYKIDIFNSSGTQLAQWGGYGSGDGDFSYPNGISVDGTGKVYVADTGNARIQIFTSDGVFLGKWGHADWSNNAPFAVASDGKGKVYVAESGAGGAVKVFDSAGMYLRQLGSLGEGPDQYLAPGGVATDSDGNVYVVDTSSGRVQVFTAAGAFVKTAAEGSFGYGIGVDQSRSVYVTNATPDYSGIEIFDNTGKFVRTLYSSDGGELIREHFWYPMAIAVGANGNVYALDSGNDGLSAFDSAGNQLAEWWAYGARPGQLSRPQGLATDSSGNVYVTDGHDYTAMLNNRIQLFSSQGAPLGTITGDFVQTSGITLDAGGNIYVLDTHDADNWVQKDPYSLVKVFDTSGNLLRSWGDPIANELGTDDVFGIAIDKSGRFIISDSDASSVRIYDGTGRFVRYLGIAGSGNGQFDRPKGIATDNDGNIYVVDSGNARIQVFDSAYNFIRSWGGKGGAYGLFWDPAGIAVDPAGHVYVADTINCRIQVFDKTGTFLLAWGRYGEFNGQFVDPLGVTLNKTGTRVYVADTGNNRIQVFEGFPAGGYSMSGTVRQGSTTGAVLPGATVAIAGKTTTTSSTGTFGISDIPSGTYTLTISKSGYVTKTVAGYVVSNNQSGLVFYLVPAYTMSGMVRQGSATGPVLAGATVAIAGKTTTTSSTGTFGITGVPGGTYTVTISKTGWVTNKITGYEVTCDSSGLEFYLTPVTYSLSGTVRQGSATGPILSGATVAIAGKSAITSSTGAFSITEVPPGTYTLTVSKSGYATKTVPGCVINRNIGGAAFYLLPTCTMSGTVRQGSATGPVLAGASVAIAGKTATTSSTGAFSITGIPAGSYTVTISKAGFVTKTATGYLVNSNKSGLVFFLTPAYSLSGTLRQGSAAGPVLTGATVAIAGKTATTSSTGAFTITGIPAGSYTLTISKAGYATKVISGYAINSNKSGLMFFLSPTYTISGTVRQGRAIGPALAGAKVAVAGKSAITGSTGAFIITGIPAGSYTVTISRIGYVTKSVTGYVVNSNKSGLVFYLNLLAGR